MLKSCSQLLVLLVSSVLLGCDQPTPEVWPQFRGPNSQGVAKSQHAPIEFGPEKNVLWKTNLPAGHSSPCIWHNRIFLTSHDADTNKLELWCIDRGSGATRWRRQIPARQIEKGHPSFNPASSTPATDGKHVVVYFGSCGLTCFDFKGKQQWKVLLPLAKTLAGSATSPVIAQDHVILYRATYDKHYVFAVSLASGKELWRHNFQSRFSASDACSATPVLWQDQILLHCKDGVSAHSLHNGNRLWWLRSRSTATSTHVLGDKHLFVATWYQTGEAELLPEYSDFDSLLKENDQDGDQQLTEDELPEDLIYYSRPEGDAPESSYPVEFRELDPDKSGKMERQEWTQFLELQTRRRQRNRNHGLLAVRLNGHGNVTRTHVRVLETRSIPEVPSPIYHEGHVYLVKNGGILTCVNTQTGKRVYRKRIGPAGTYYASPILAGHRLYISSGGGRVTVIDVAAKTPRVLAQNEFGENIFATPAIVDDTLYLRTEQSLYAIASP
ncbi:MAG: hypothetical protein CMJ62_01865 [Planctomycetaceae bacterium]|nr:hypothetical protein [Planctomycetaceae bacterium]